MELDMEDMDMEDEGMTLEELKKKMPPYFFIHGKKRNKFFKDQNVKWRNNLNRQPNAPVEKYRRITFNLAKNKIKSKLFDC